MSSTRKTWISILLAVVIIAVVFGVAAIGGTALFIHRHVNATFVPTDTAAAEFAQAKKRFSGQQPMIELASDGDEPTIHRDSAGTPQPVNTLHVLAYDPRASKLVHADIPGWLLRLASARGHIRLANLDVFDGDEQLTLADLERHGPGLVLDVTRRRGQRVLVWTD